MRSLLLVVVAGCAVSPPALAPTHPASALAPAGRLAGAPASLRPGVVEYPDVPAARTEPAPHHHHHTP
jgi:hypothetical protein